MTEDALDGIRVLDLTRLMPFAYGTQLLVDAGADVVKVEPPGGEYGRGMQESFRLTNRGKRSIEIDLREASGVALLLELATKADVLVESFRPGVLERAGAGYEAVSKINPRLVYVSGVGFAADGPRAERPGHDLNYAAVAGLLSLDGNEPVFPDTPYVDMVTGWSLAASVLLGLAAVARNGRGSYRCVSMADTALSLNVLGVSAVNAERAQRSMVADGPLDGYPWPGLMRSETPCYGVFRAGDGRWLALANVEPKFWNAFIREIGRPDLEADRFATGRRGQQVRSEIAAVVATKDRAEWIARLSRVDVCATEVNTPAEAIADAEFSPLVSLEDDEVVVASPLSRRHGGGHSQAVPQAGEHAEQILSEFGIGHDPHTKGTDDGPHANER